MAKENYIRPLDIRHGIVDMTYGAGGRATAQLIDEVFARAFDNTFLAQAHDGAVMPPLKGEPVMSCDGHVVHPLFFAGGDIGRLAVCGTVNDVAVCGAKPLYLSASFIIEEGLPLQTLADVVKSMAEAAREAGVAIVTGDTKVVEKGHGHGLFISTTGMGEKIAGTHVSGRAAKPGDAVLVTGTMGDHGITILSQREGLGFEAQVQSDTAPLNGITEALLAKFGHHVPVLRDPTRGGRATTRNEIAAQHRVGIEIEEDEIPLHPAVVSACEFLGLDPLYIANEGKLIVIVDAEVADDALALIRTLKYGENAAIIGRVTVKEPGIVSMTTSIGGSRLVDWLNSDPLPRIC